MKRARTELPYILACPGSHEDFISMLERYPDAPLRVVLERIFKSNSVHVAAENRNKLVHFSRILIDHLILIVDAA